MRISTRHWWVLFVGFLLILAAVTTEYRYCWAIFLGAIIHWAGADND